MVGPQRYERFKSDCEVLEYHNNNHCTNIWLGLIFFVLLLQAFIVVGAGVTTVVLYTHNQEKVNSWINLPWTEMAQTVGTTYNNVKDTPVSETLNNAYFSASKLRSMLDYHDKTTLRQVKLITDELMKNKDSISKISDITKETIPALKQINTVLKPGTVGDITGILHKTNTVMSYFNGQPEETKKNYKRGTDMVDNANHLLSPENVQRTLASIEKISNALDSTLTPDNVNRTLHAISDFDSSLHTAESRLEKIGLIFAKT